jgi:hypothetical protein
MVIRWLCAFTLLGACGNRHELPAVASGVSLVLELPQGMYDPMGFSSVEVVLHEPSGDVRRSASLAADGSFDLGAIDPSKSVSVEATLRSDSGGVVGYGRTATAAAFASGSEIAVPVRRPIVYFAGTVDRDADNNGNTTNDTTWSETPPTFSDLSIGGTFDGTAVLASPAVMMVAAGPSLYMITQAIDAKTGALMGPARIVPISPADHAAGAALGGSMTGAVLDGAGSDDGNTLVVGTQTELFAIDATTGAVTALTDGSFARVALTATATGGLAAVAIKNRGATTATCSTSAELWWADLTAGPAAAHRVAIGGFSDIAADRGHAYYVDACSGELGEVTSAQTMAIRTIDTAGGTTRPTALAVSNGQAYLGLETAPATTALMFASLTTSESRTLWSESSQQVLNATDTGDDGVQRQLDASSAVVNQLEIGAGGDYVALTTAAQFHGARIDDANFPAMTINTDELRVLDAATGATVERYRSWCDGVVNELNTDILDWECAATAGQTEAANAMLEHHIGSMTFLFGKK